MNNKITIEDSNSSILANEYSIINMAKMIFVSTLNNGDTSNWNSSYISTDTSSLKLLELPHIEKLTGNRFYFLNMFNASHYEYNLGKIPVIFSYNQMEQSKSLMLFPIDYCCSESTSKFMEQFKGKDIFKKDTTAEEIASMLLTTKTRHLINCDKVYYNLEYYTDFNNDTLTVTIRYNDMCKSLDMDLNQEIDSNKLIRAKKTIFIFTENKIKNIDFNDWNK